MTLADAAATFRLARLLWSLSVLSWAGVFVFVA